jgi:hypothetical protein
MRRAVAYAQEHAKVDVSPRALVCLTSILFSSQLRNVGNVPLADKPLHLETLADLELETRAATQLMGELLTLFF